MSGLVSVLVLLKMMLAGQGWLPLASPRLVMAEITDAARDTPFFFKKKRGGPDGSQTNVKSEYDPIRTRKIVRIVQVKLPRQFSMTSNTLTHYYDISWKVS